MTPMLVAYKYNTVEMAMEMEMEKEMVQSYLVVPKKRWRTLLSMQSRNNKLPTVPTTVRRPYFRASNSQDSRDKKAWDQ